MHEHLVDGKRRCLQALVVSVEPASDALVQQLCLSGNPSIWLPSECMALYSHGPTVKADGLLPEFACT